MKSKIHRDPAGAGPTSIALLCRSAFAIGAMLTTGIAMAAAAGMSEAKAR